MAGRADDGVRVDVRPHPAGGGASLLNVNGTLFFTADDGTNSAELWKSDGTAGGTVLVEDIRPGVDGSSPLSFVNVNGTLLSKADDGTHDYQLWKSDGTAGGTVLVKDIAPVGSFSGYMHWRTTVNDTLFFNANDGTHGYELWERCSGCC